MILAAIGMTTDARAECDDRPFTPDQVQMVAKSSTSLEMSWRLTGGGSVWFDMYLDYEGGGKTGRNLTGVGDGIDEFGRQKPYLNRTKGERLSTTWVGLTPNTSYCGALRTRTAPGTKGCVSQITSNWACAKTLPASGDAVQPRFRDGVDLPGGDYLNFSVVNATECEAACNRNGLCRAWTWVKPGVQGPKAQCYLKNAVPKDVVSNCCMSGIKAR
jgi:hypothetical protein